MRKIKFNNDEYYHVYNRGTDKRVIFIERSDSDRFLCGMEEFNTIEPIGSIFENVFRKNKQNQLGNLVSKSKKDPKKLVELVCYCLNSNHYHFILKQVADRGIEKFMHRLGLGYAKYFNLKYKRNGTLFQGPFKAIHINSNEYLLHLSAYVNLNYKVHKLGNLVSKSSWEEYIGEKEKIKRCNAEIVLDQFKNPTEYQKFAEETIITVRERKDMERFLFE